jgi:hypothetical protein
MFLLSVIASEAEQSRGREASLDCFVAEPVIGRAFARPVGSSQRRPSIRAQYHGYRVEFNDV